MKLRAVYTLSLSAPSVGSSTRPTLVATYDKVPYGVAVLQVLALSCDPTDAAVADLQVIILEKYLKIHLVALAPALGILFLSYPHSQ